MKSIRIVFFACLFLIDFSTLCTGMEIKKAVVYNDSAYLNFEWEIRGHVAIEAPPEMVPESLTLVPLKGGSIRSVSVEPLRAVSGKVKEPQDTLGKKKALLASIRREQAMVEKQVEIIYEAAGAKGKATSFEKTRLAEALGFIDNKVTGLNTRLVELSGKAEKIELEIKDLQDQLNSVSRNPGYKIDIVADGTVEISYVIKGASWRPEYRVFAAPDASQLILEVSALIAQSSGLDWDIKEMLVSTGRPSFGIQAPELKPWYLYKAYPISKRAMKSMGDSLQADAAQAAAPMEEAALQVESTTISHLIGAAKNIHLPGDGTPSTVQLQQQLLTAEFKRITVPKYSQQVYLRAECTLHGDVPLVPGPYSAFVDGVFSGRGDVERIEPEQMITLDLGIDEGIKAKRKELKVFHEKTLTGKDRTTYAYVITIENTRNIQSKVIVKDQIPISQDEGITVDLIKADPQAKPDQEGILVWTIDLGPRKKEQAEFSFSVTGIQQLRPY
jgi:uncharacterized protein (TIGR02231 family)